MLLPGCGQFLPEASFLVRPATGDRLIAMVLTSTVAEGVGHTTQICVMPGYQGHNIGRQLMESSILALRRRQLRIAVAHGDVASTDAPSNSTNISAFAP